MENSGVAVFEAVIVAHDSEEKLGILSQISGRSQQPAIAELSLLYVEAGVAFDEELRVVANFHRSQPFVATVSTTRVEQTLIGAWEFGIFKKSSRVEALLTYCVEILDIRLTANSTRLFTDLKWIKFDFN